MAEGEPAAGRRAEEDELLELFDEALALPPADRPRLLDLRCQGRPALRAEIDSLLGHASADPQFLEQRPAAVAALLAPRTPSQVGPYRLTERLGEGGFGEVWRAEQKDPIVRSVAVKLIRPGVGTDQARARFAAERQALALLDHPGIARIHDAGTTDDGQPWYAMELVDGPSIRSFASQRRLGLADRLRLVIEVCDALHHAHERGIVHRDLKPSNVLVQLSGERPQPKIIDFGIAKLEESGIAWRTQDGQVLGTPAYMSPEQARGDTEAVDARTDVHAVGVLLFELLTGTLPFEPPSDDAAGLLALRHRICEDDAPRPSSRIAERDQDPGYRAPVLARAVRGDLDWIVLKALAKARQARYRSARELGADLERFLRDQPVTAMPPRRFYRLRKWLQRHRAAALVGVLAVLLGTAGAVGTWLNRERAERSERSLQTEARKLAEVAAFLRGMLASADPESAPGREVTVRELLDAAEAQLQTAVAPEVESALRFTLGMSYRGLGRPLDAERNLRRALDLADHHGGEERGEIRRELGLLFADAGRRTEAAALIDEALALAGEDLARRAFALDARGMLHLGAARYGEAADDFRAALAAGEVAAVDPGVPAAIRLHLADALESAGAYDEARAALDAAERAASAEGERGLPRLLQVRSARIRVLLRGADPQQALGVSQDCVALAERIYGKAHFEVGFHRCNNAETLQANDRLVEAEAEFRAGLEVLRNARPAGSISEARALGNLGWTLVRLDHAAEAEVSLRQSLELRRRLLGPDHPDVAVCLRDLSSLLRRRGALAEAEQACREAMRICRDKYGPEHLEVAVSAHALALCLLAAARPAEAVDCLEDAVRIAEPVLPPGHRDRIEFGMRLGHAYLAAGRFADARRSLEQSYELVARVAGPTDPRASICAAAMLELARLTGDEALREVWARRR
jgi:non-specific serine/threonine protein kinase/serine/threonine-protein kinase